MKIFHSHSILLTITILCLSFLAGCGGGGDSGGIGGDSGGSQEKYADLWSTGFPKPSEIRAITATPTLNDIAAAYDALVAQHPDLSPEGSQFATLLFERIKSGASRQRSYEILGTKLTKDELVLCILRPHFAKRTRTAAAEATSLAPKIFPSKLLKPAYLTQADAFRHAYWNVLMAKRCSPWWAAAFADAHESETPDGDDKAMDLNNNAVGRRIFSGTTTASDQEHQDQIKNSRYVFMASNVSFDESRLVFTRDPREDFEKTPVPGLGLFNRNADKNLLISTGDTDQRFDFGKDADGNTILGCRDFGLYPAVGYWMGTIIIDLRYPAYTAALDIVPPGTSGAATVVFQDQNGKELKKQTLTDLKSRQRVEYKHGSPQIKSIIVNTFFIGIDNIETHCNAGDA